MLYVCLHNAAQKSRNKRNFFFFLFEKKKKSNTIEFFQLLDMEFSQKKIACGGRLLYHVQPLCTCVTFNGIEEKIYNE